MEKISSLSRWIMLLCGMVELIFFGGVLLGWADLVYLLKREGFFAEKCSQDTTVPCDYQQNALDLAFTIGAVCKGLTSVLIAYILDHFGFRVAKITGIFAIVTAGFLLGFTTKDTPYCLYPATILFSIGGNHIRLSNYTIANLFPKQKSTIISLYNGAFSSSAVFFLLLKYATDFGIERRTSCFVWAGCAGIMILPLFFLFPYKEIVSDDATDCLIRNIDNATVPNTKSYGTVALSSSVHFGAKQASNDNGYLLTYMLHVWWFCALATALSHYSGNYNRWIVLSTNDYHVETQLSELYGLCQIPMFFTAPLIGLLMDYCVHKASENPDKTQQKVDLHRAGFWSLVLTGLIYIALYTCMFFNNTAAIKGSLAILVFARPFTNSVAYSFVRIRFPQEKFNRLAGTMTTIVGLFILIQFPLFLFAGKYPKAALILVIAVIVTSFASPIHLFIQSRKHKQVQPL